MKKAILPLLLAVSILTITSCNKEKEVYGYKPVYLSTEAFTKVEVQSEAMLKNAGRIYTYQNYILVNDKSKGIHIYDNSNASNPVHLSFISIPGNMDFSIKQNMLYADNITDIVIIDISQMANPVYKNRISNVFPIQNFPDEAGPFECVDVSKGVVVGWEKSTLINPNCLK